MNTEIFEKRESKIRGNCRAYPTVFAKAKGVKQYDENGKEYLDFFSGAGVLNFGHNNPHMTEAVVKYIQDGGVIHSLDMYTVAKRDFIQAFVETILKPRNMDHRLQFMGPTGTNAVEAAMKLARRVTGRETVYCFGHGFHGATLGALSCTANNYFRNAAGVPMPYTHRVPFQDPEADPNDVSALKELRCRLQDSSSGLEKPAAFLVEPIQAEGGVNPASKAWLKELREIANENGALLILDDIQAGCGRTGSYFSFDELDVDPDIVTLAKGVGGLGTPLAVNLVKPEYDEYWKPAEHTGTFRGQNLSFIAGREALRYFENSELMDDVKKKGQGMAKNLESIVQKHSNLKLHARGRGMMQGFDFKKSEFAQKVLTECFNQGLLVASCGTAGSVIKLLPPLVIEQNDLDRGMKIFEKVVDSVLANN